MSRHIARLFRAVSYSRTGRWLGHVFLAHACTNAQVIEVGEIQGNSQISLTPTPTAPQPPPSKLLNNVPISSMQYIVIASTNPKLQKSFTPPPANWGLRERLYRGAVIMAKIYASQAMNEGVIAIGAQFDKILEPWKPQPQWLVGRSVWRMYGVGCKINCAN